MLTITEYLKEIFEKFKEHCDEETENMWEPNSYTSQLKNNSPRLDSGGTSIYDNPTVQQMYLLKYAYAYGFEYLSICNEFMEDFADQEEISVVSLGCGTMLDYWALACMLDQKRMSRPVVKYYGIDAIKWNHSLETQARDKDTVKFFQESFADFFKRHDNEFNTHDVYFFPKSISEFSVKKNGKIDEASDMGLMLNNLSAMKKDTIYFCIALRKNNNGVAKEDVGKVQKIIDRLEDEKNGFHVKEVKCITNTEATVSKLEESGLHLGDVTSILLGRKQNGKDKKIWDTDIAKNILGYPQISEDDPITGYREVLQKKCKYRSPEKGDPCEGCNKDCKIEFEKTMTATNYICDLIIKVEKKRTL